MILVVDNYDSFAYNLVQYVGQAVGAGYRVPGNGADIVVRRNDEIDVERIHDLDPDGIVVSPGPGTPPDAGVSVDVFAQLSFPTLGVCLGHQALCAAHGVAVGHAPEVVHGKASLMTHDGQGIYTGLPESFQVGRYHSLAVTVDLPDCLVATARTVGVPVDPVEKPDEQPGERDVLMGVRHVSKPHIDAQFHPESILTDVGYRLVENFCHDIASGASQSPVA